MKKINLRELYPDIYKTDTYLEVTDEVQAVFLSDKRAEAAHERQMYRYTLPVCSALCHSFDPSFAATQHTAKGTK